jgi:hypothetical protein
MAHTAIRRVFLPETAIIAFPITRLTPNSYRQNIMGGQFFIVDRQWAKWAGHKRVEPSGLALAASIRSTYGNQILTVIQVMVPPYSKEPFFMWVRLKTFLAHRGSTDNPRQYVMNTISRWHLTESISGRPTILLGDFNQTAETLNTWQRQHDLTRAHHNLKQIAQHYPPRPLCTYKRSNARTHIDHIYHSPLEPIQLTQIGATDHPHIWIGLLWPVPLPDTRPTPSSPPIVNRPDLCSDDPTATQRYASALEHYVSPLSLDSDRISTLTPEQAGQYQAAIMSTSSKLAQQSTPKPRHIRPVGYGKRFKNRFSPDFRLLQLSLYTYVNLQRIHKRPRSSPNSGSYGLHGGQLIRSTTQAPLSMTTLTPTSIL